MIKFASTLHTTLVYSPSSCPVYWRMLIERGFDAHTFVKPFAVLQADFAVDSQLSDPEVTKTLQRSCFKFPVRWETVWVSDLIQRDARRS